MTDIYRCWLAPRLRANGSLEVLMCQGEQVEGVLPQPLQPGELLGQAVWVGDTVPCPWTPAHMAIVYQFVWQCRRAVSCVRPVDGLMILTSVADA